MFRTLGCYTTFCFDLYSLQKAKSGQILDDL